MRQRCFFCGEISEYPEGPGCFCEMMAPEQQPEPTIEDYCDPHPYYGDDGSMGRCYCGLKRYAAGGGELTPFVGCPECGASEGPCPGTVRNPQGCLWWGKA